jgi:hypothetical protein
MMSNNTQYNEQINCGNKKYLSEVEPFNDGLPKNCLFHKGMTGVGGTTIALNDDFPTVICLPFKSVIDNKVKQSLDKPGSFKYDLIPYYSGYEDKDTKKKIMSSKVPKILVTYDSLGRLLNLINPEEFNLVIDEYDCLITEYLYRDLACDVVYDNYKKFKNYTFMTATPMKRDFLTFELSKIRIVEAIWDERDPVQILPLETTSIIKTLAIRIAECLNNIKEGNLYIFVNSVIIANQLIRHCKLNNENTRFIFSDSNTTPIPNGINRGKTTDAPKKINIITKTGFHGCDIDDEMGRIIVVSDGLREHTFVDVSITMPQIIGRIRNSKYSNVIHHIFSKNYRTNAFNMSNEDFIEYLTQQEKEATDALIEYWHTSSKTQQSWFHSCVKKNNSESDYFDFIRLNSESKPELNERKLQALKFSYHVRSMYDSSKSLTMAYAATNFKLGALEFENPEFELIPQGSFRGIIDANKYAVEILTKKEEGIALTLEETQLLKECYYEYPDLEKAYIYFGIEEFRDNETLHKGNLRNRIVAEEISLLKTNSEDKVSTFMLNSGLLKIGDFKSTNELRSALRTTYEYLGINLPVKASDIKNYFIAIKDTGRLVKNGTKHRGYYIVGRKDKWRDVA